MSWEEQSIPLTFEKGLLEYYSGSALPIGYVAECRNWRPTQFGGLKVRPPWVNTGTTNAPTTRTARGLGYLAKPSKRLLVAHKASSTSYGVYYAALSDLSAGYTLLETVSGLTDATKHVAFAAGLGNIFYCTNEFSTIRRWAGTDAAASVAGSKPGGFLVFHKNRVFSGGSSDYPYRLWYCDVGDYTTWGADSYVDVGEDDGEAIEWGATVDNGLLIGKQNSLYFLTGAGRDTFQLHPLNAGNAAPGMSVISTPHGAVIVGRETIWLWGGGVPQLISKPVETTFGMAGVFVSCAYVDGTLYVVDESSATMVCYDFIEQAWHTEVMDTAAEAPVVLLSRSDYLFGGPKAATTGSLAWYKQFPNANATRDPGIAETFRIKTPELWLGGASRPIMDVHLYLKLRQHGGDSGDASMTVTPTIDGTAGTDQYIKSKDGGNQTFQQRVDLGADGARWMQIEMEHVLTTSDAATFSIEEAELRFKTGGPK